ncbi:MAG: alpha/beta hydrolase [Hyphomicrobium zavarzinii]|jgi:alpha/beta superfamily hydrolase|uniref:alpha/beta hydrolase n=1 Tax=Hyphomicrobium TaxID=81 RepID=UPI00035D0529|nr:MULTISPECIES: alpha/beta hydrolase [Hyphomicrobium]MBL8847275.1 alpha/beta hydrolase [Hyphomicrobium zavarzinii]WBT37402.1 alpha/beta hydrolase [Hyphomicrobium sp. DMF-1]HML42820.1 alpha/beta hydrolase [Hyphomicrobium zavarzinii]
MPELIINGPAGRIEARYHHEPASDSPIALILHPHPQFGGTMNNQVVYSLYYTFAQRGFSVLRFNFRGVGRSQGFWDGGPGELADAASALDWLQTVKPDAKYCWIAGVSFGTWIAMQLLMRRPEVDGFICVAPPSNLYDFSFLAPCPSSGLMVNGDKDRVVPSNSVAELTGKLKTQRGIKIDHEIIPGANHFFENKTEELETVVGGYLDMRLAKALADRESQKEREKEREAAREREREREREEASSGVAEVEDGDDE